MFPYTHSCIIKDKRRRWSRYVQIWLAFGLLVVPLLSCRRPIESPEDEFEPGPGSATVQPPLTITQEEILVFVAREPIHKNELLDAFIFEIAEDFTLPEGVQQNIKAALFDFANPGLPEMVEQNTTVILPAKFRAFDDLASLTASEALLSSTKNQLLLITLRTMTFTEVVEEAEVTAEQLLMLNPHLDASQEVPAYSVLLRPR